MKARAIREHKTEEDLGECIRQMHTHLRRKFVPCSRTLSITSCLELLSRTARAIAGHLKEDLGECIRQIHTHLRRQCPGLRSFGVFRSREVFFFETKFYLSIPESSLPFYKRLFDFNKAVI